MWMKDKRHPLRAFHLLGSLYKLMWMKDKRHPLCAKGCMCQSNSPKLPMAVDVAVR